MTEPRKEIIEAARTLIPIGAVEAYLMESTKHSRASAENSKENIQVIVFYSGLPEKQWKRVPWASDAGRWFQRTEPLRVRGIEKETEYAAQLLVCSGFQEEAARKGINSGVFDAYKLSG